MKVRFEINKKRGAGAARRTVAAAVMAVAAIFFLSLADATVAQAGMQSESNTLTGEVMAVNPVRGATTLTLISSQIGQFPNNELNIFLNSNTKVKVCSEREPVNDINVSRNATVTYHEVGGVAVAEQVSEQC